MSTPTENAERCRRYYAENSAAILASQKARHRERMATDTAYAERYRADKREREKQRRKRERARMATDPAFAAMVRERERKRKAKRAKPKRVKSKPIRAPINLDPVTVPVRCVVDAPKPKPWMTAALRKRLKRRALAESYRRAGKNSGAPVSETACG